MGSALVVGKMELALMSEMSTRPPAHYQVAKPLGAIIEQTAS